RPAQLVLKQARPIQFGNWFRNLSMNFAFAAGRSTGRAASLTISLGNLRAGASRCGSSPPCTAGVGRLLDTANSLHHKFDQLGFETPRASWYLVRRRSALTSSLGWGRDKKR